MTKLTIEAAKEKLDALWKATNECAKALGRGGDLLEVQQFVREFHDPATQNAIKAELDHAGVSRETVELASRTLVDCIGQNRFLKEGGYAPVDLLATIDCRGANLTRLKFSKQRGEYVDARGADFSGSDISEVSFQGADLRGAKLATTPFYSFNPFFRGANLCGTDLTWMTKTDLKRINLDEAFTFGAQFGDDTPPKCRGLNTLRKMAASINMQVAYHRGLEPEDDSMDSFPHRIEGYMAFAGWLHSLDDAELKKLGIKNHEALQILDEPLEAARDRLEQETGSREGLRYGKNRPPLSRGPADRIPSEACNGGRGSFAVTGGRYGRVGA